MPGPAAGPVFWNRWNAQTKVNTVYPIVYTIQSSTATAAQAEKLQGSVYRGVHVGSTFFFVLMGAGVVCLVSVGLWITNELRRTKSGYAEL